MRRIIWTDEAITNLDGICAYIHEFNPAAARRLGERLIDAAESLEEYSYRGRALASGLREFTVIYPYIIRYRVTDDAVVILRIRHGARRPD